VQGSRVSLESFRFKPRGRQPARVRRLRPKG
jgi:hypothetical protein